MVLRVFPRRISQTIFAVNLRPIKRPTHYHIGKFYLALSIPNPDWYPSDSLPLIDLICRSTTQNQSPRHPSCHLQSVVPNPSSTVDLFCRSTAPKSSHQSFSFGSFKNFYSKPSIAISQCISHHRSDLQSDGLHLIALDLFIGCVFNSCFFFPTNCDPLIGSGSSTCLDRSVLDFSLMVSSLSAFHQKDFNT